MKTFFILLSVWSYILASVNLNAAEPTTILSNLNQLEWAHRIIIIHEKENSTTQTLKIIKTQKIELDDRDIIWFVLSANKNQLTSNFDGQLDNSLKQQLSSITNNPNYQVILIGKDGGIKSRNKNLDLQNIFAQIDAMPMRINEMQTKQ